MRTSESALRERGTSGLSREERMAAYERGVTEFSRLTRDPTFRDFVGLYVAQGWRRSRAMVAVTSSDPAAAALSAHWIGRLSARRVDYRLEFGPGQDLVELVRFWARHLGVPHGQIRLQRRLGEASGGEDCMPRFGRMTVRTHDAVLGVRLQAWMDEVRGSWSVSHEAELPA